MNTKSLTGRLRGLFLIATAALSLALSGCLFKRVVWSPDGNRAAVITKEGLRWCNAEGRLSPLQLPDVAMAAWLGGSDRLLCARSRELDRWNAIEESLGATRSGVIAAEAEEVMQKLRAGGLWNIVMLFHGEEGDAVTVYLREKYPDEFRKHLGDGWDDAAAATVTVHEVIGAQFVGDRIESRLTAFSTLEDIIEMRPSPDGQYAIVVTDPEKGDDAVLHVTSTSVKGDDRVVATSVAAYPDWTPDSRSVVYVQGAGSAPDSSDLTVGAVVRHEVRATDGTLSPADQGDELVGVLMNTFMRVRCLPDGRILFNAVEMSLPVATVDVGESREQLFALDPSRQSTLVRLVPRKSEAALPDMLAFFEVSPDASEVVFGGMKGGVWLLTVATGEVECVQSEEGDLQGAPTWRRAGELSYMRRTPAPPEGQSRERQAELVLRQGATETTLSGKWSDDEINGVVKD